MIEPAASVKALLARGGEVLAAVSDTPRLDVELLLCHALGRDRTWLFTWPEKIVSDVAADHFTALLSRRRRGEPIAHILGYREFWSLSLKVDASTLIPRPETELLVEWCLQLDFGPGARVLDLGTGTGAIALALATERPGWRIEAVDKSAAAVALAEENRRRLQLDNVSIFSSDWYGNVAGDFDIIVSNPPYIDAVDPHLGRGDVRFEPRSALVAGEAGLMDIAAIARGARRRLREQGVLLAEHGYNQAGKVRELFRDAGFTSVETRPDLSGHPRATMGRSAPSGRA